MSGGLAQQDQFQKYSPVTQSLKHKHQMLQALAPGAAQAHTSHLCWTVCREQEPAQAFYRRGKEDRWPMSGIMEILGIPPLASLIALTWRNENIRYLKHLVTRTEQNAKNDFLLHTLVKLEKLPPYERLFSSSCGGLQPSVANDGALRTPPFENFF